MRPRVRKWRLQSSELSGLALVLAWLIAWEAPLLLGPWWSDVDYFPSLGVVGYPWTKGSDIISIVPFLFRALGLGVVAALVAEAGKGLAILTKIRWPTSFWVVALCFQATVVLDTLRIHAYDWFIYGASFFGLVQLQREKIVGYATIWMADFPWLSLPFLLVLLVQLRLSSRRRSGRPEADSPARP